MALFFDIYLQAMEYYALQVKTRFEQKYIDLFRATYPGSAIEIYFPRRRLPTRKGGIITQELLPVFQGYVFAGFEGDLPYSIYRQLRTISGFTRLLCHPGLKLKPLKGRDLSMVLHFIRTGPVAGISKVYFNDQDRIVVMEGVLKGLEGRIIKVDKRKGRAKIQFDLYDDSHTIDLAFEVIKRVKHN